MADGVGNTCCDTTKTCANNPHKHTLHSQSFFSSALLGKLSLLLAAYNYYCTDLCVVPKPQHDLTELLRADNFGNSRCCR